MSDKNTQSDDLSSSKPERVSDCLKKKSGSVNEFLGQRLRSSIITKRESILIKSDDLKITTPTVNVINDMNVMSDHNHNIDISLKRVRSASLKMTITPSIKETVVTGFSSEKKDTSQNIENIVDQTLLAKNVFNHDTMSDIDDEYDDEEVEHILLSRDVSSFRTLTNSTHESNYIKSEKDQIHDPFLASKLGGSHIQITPVEFHNQDDLSSNKPKRLQNCQKKKSGSVYEFLGQRLRSSIMTKRESILIKPDDLTISSETVNVISDINGVSDHIQEKVNTRSSFKVDKKRPSIVTERSSLLEELNEMKIHHIVPVQNQKQPSLLSTQIVSKTYHDEEDPTRNQQNPAIAYSQLKEVNTRSSFKVDKKRPSIIAERSSLLEELNEMKIHHTLPVQNQTQPSILSTQIVSKTYHDEEDPTQYQQNPAIAYSQLKEVNTRSSFKVDKKRPSITAERSSLLEELNEMKIHHTVPVQNQTQPSLLSTQIVSKTYHDEEDQTRYQQNPAIAYSHLKEVNTRSSFLDNKLPSIIAERSSLLEEFNEMKIHQTVPVQYQTQPSLLSNQRVSKTYNDEEDQTRYQQNPAIAYSQLKEVNRHFSSKHGHSSNIDSKQELKDSHNKRESNGCDGINKDTVIPDLQTGDTAHNICEELFKCLLNSCINSTTLTGKNEMIGLTEVLTLLSKKTATDSALCKVYEVEREMIPESVVINNTWQKFKKLSNGLADNSKQANGLCAEYFRKKMMTIEVDNGLSYSKECEILVAYKEFLNTIPFEIIFEYAMDQLSTNRRYNHQRIPKNPATQTKLPRTNLGSDYSSYSCCTSKNRYMRYFPDNGLEKPIYNCQRRVFLHNYRYPPTVTIDVRTDGCTKCDNDVIRSPQITDGRCDKENINTMNDCDNLGCSTNTYSYMDNRMPTRWNQIHGNVCPPLSSYTNQCPESCITQPSVRYIRDEKIPTILVNHEQSRTLRTNNHQLFH